MESVSIAKKGIMQTIPLKLATSRRGRSVKVGHSSPDDSAHVNLMTEDLQAAHERLTLLSGRRDQKPVVSVVDLSPIEDSFLVSELPTTVRNPIG